MKVLLEAALLLELCCEEFTLLLKEELLESVLAWDDGTLDNAPSLLTPRALDSTLDCDAAILDTEEDAGAEETLLEVDFFVPEPEPPHPTRENSKNADIQSLVVAII